MGGDGLHLRNRRHPLILDPIEGGRHILVDDRMLDWIARRIQGMGPGYEWQMASAIGLVAKDKIIAGMAVHSFQPRYKSCELTFAADTPLWATKQSIRAMMRWPFIQLGCERVMTIVASSNQRALRVQEHLGFKLEGVCRKGCLPDDAMIFGLLREEAPEWMDVS